MLTEHKINEVLVMADRHCKVFDGMFHRGRQLVGGIIRVFKGTFWSTWGLGIIRTDWIARLYQMH